MTQENTTKPQAEKSEALTPEKGGQPSTGSSAQGQQRQQEAHQGKRPDQKDGQKDGQKSPQKDGQDAKVVVTERDKPMTQPKR